MSAYPDPTRPGVGAVFVSTWDVGTPERQRAAAAAVADAWAKRPWPTPGPLTYSVYAGTDGRTLLHYSQWPDEEAYDGFVRDHRSDRNGEVDAAVPGIERLALYRTRLHRSLYGGREGGARRPAPGCVVLVNVEFDGPDEERQRDWVDTVARALEADRPGEILPPGGISAHFHLSTDGTRVLNYAEWESVQAHVDALAAPSEGIGGPSPLWRRVREYPGLVRSDVSRYELLFTTARSEDPAAPEPHPAG